MEVASVAGGGGYTHAGDIHIHGEVTSIRG